MSYLDPCHVWCYTHHNVYLFFFVFISLVGGDFQLKLTLVCAVQSKLAPYFLSSLICSSFFAPHICSSDSMISVFCAVYIHYCKHVQAVETLVCIFPCYAYMRVFVCMLLWDYLNSGLAARHACLQVVCLYCKGREQI